ncbi:hypothetical protein V6N11_072197 [Hibiscus sabdariffa]|uniref:AP complex mu/sigma subunit domain-containing protein n=1 Tax=Hibiscus sabdariffa TaxID=183260 RepID=A0ABR2U2D5_9ROSI
MSRSNCLAAVLPHPPFSPIQSNDAIRRVLQSHRRSSKGSSTSISETLSHQSYCVPLGGNWKLETIHFVLLISRQGKVRLTKLYSPYSQKERTKVIRELSGVILRIGPKLCNFVD